MIGIDSWDQEWLFQRCRKIIQAFYGVDEWSERGSTWIACHQCYMHDICQLMEVSHA